MSNLGKLDIKRLTMKLCACFVMAFFCCASLSAEAGDDYEDETESIKSPAVSNMNEVGDQYIKIGIMVTKPINFDGTLLLGGAGELGYHRFITQNLLWGIDVSFGYNPTIGENIFTYVPLTFGMTYQPTIKKFEIPFTASVGIAMENYLSKTYFPGLAVKGAAGVFYRATPSWSFGVEGQFMFLPQLYSNPDYNDYGLFGSIELAARYHF